LVTKSAEIDKRVLLSLLNDARMAGELSETGTLVPYGTRTNIDTSGEDQRKLVFRGSVKERFMTGEIKGRVQPPPEGFIPQRLISVLLRKEIYKKGRTRLRRVVTLVFDCWEGNIVLIRQNEAKR
jgi:hypothetical protein